VVGLVHLDTRSWGRIEVAVHSALLAAVAERVLVIGHCSSSRVVGDLIAHPGLIRSEEVVEPASAHSERSASVGFEIV
jgi:hypothetical protein